MRDFARTVYSIAALCVIASGCSHRSKGGGAIDPTSTRVVDPADIEVPDGYVVEVVAQGLTYPSAVAFDDAGRPHVIEAGYSYGEDFRTPRLVRIDDDGSLQEIATGAAPPWTGITYADGSFYVAEGGARGGGAIVRIDARTGSVEPIVQNLPSYGDHHTNGPVIGPDDMLYFSIGTATNSAVVGQDNADFGWLHRHPDFHDIRCRDIVLSGRGYSTADPRPGAGKREVVTGAFIPFGRAGAKDRVIQGSIPCSGAVLRMPLVTEAMTQWLTTLGLVRAGTQGVLGRYIGYYRPYATSHDDLDRDEALWEEVRNAALALGDAVRSLRDGQSPRQDSERSEPRPK